MYSNYSNATIFLNSNLQQPKQKNLRKKTTSFFGWILFLLLFGYFSSITMQAQTSVEVTATGNGTWVVPCGGCYFY